MCLYFGMLLLLAVVTLDVMQRPHPHALVQKLYF
jgi:hypothetical protein